MHIPTLAHAAWFGLAMITCDIAALISKQTATASF